MAVLDPVRKLAETISGTRALREQMLDQMRQSANQETHLQESIAELERALNDPGWRRLTALSEQEFTPEALVQMRAVCRVMSLADPLIKRGLNLRSAYVWGGGVEIAARATGRRDGEQNVQAVVAGMLDDPGNLRAVTGPEARDQLEHALGAEGEVFIMATTRPLTGQVSLRTIPADQIVDVISNPEDDSEPWYYHRRWTSSVVDLDTGAPMTQTLERYYPALDYRPAARRPRIGSHPVAWDSPVLHVAVNRPLHWKRGVPDAYAAVDWARAYKTFLENWARLMASLSRFAWKATTPGNKASAVKARLAQSPSRDLTGEANEAGGTAILPPDVALQAVSKSGATIDSDSGRPLAAMAAAALAVPVTMLLGDPGVTGARATAETLDPPTELEMGQRRGLWTGALVRLCAYAIAAAVRAPQGPLRGTIVRDPFTCREQVALAGDTSDAVDVTWPGLDDTDIDKTMSALQKAASIRVMPPQVLLRLILTAFGVHDADDIIDSMTGDDGEFIHPKGPSLTEGDDLAGRIRAGDDPARAGPGPMNDPDDEPDEGG